MDAKFLQPLHRIFDPCRKQITDIPPPPTNPEKNILEVGTIIQDPGQTQNLIFGWDAIILSRPEIQEHFDIKVDKNSPNLWEYIR
jgi:hypothetical protein